MISSEVLTMPIFNSRRSAFNHARCATPSAFQFALLLALLISRFPLAAQTASCPDSITVKQSLDKPPDGWSAVSDNSPNNLAGITFFNGPPDQQSSLVYDKWTRRNGLAYADWRFPKSTAIWITCRYALTNVVLAKQLPPETTQCTVTYDPKVQVAGSPSIKKIDCH
jgi:hypothetical protein